MQYLNIDPFRVILMHLYNMYTSWFLGFFLNFSKAYVYIWVQFLKNMHVYIYGQKTSKEGEVGVGAFDMGPYYCHHEYLILRLSVYIFTKQVI